VDIEAFGKQSSIAQPDSISSAELAANRGDLHLELAVIVPGPLNARAANHFVLPKQPARLIPLAANAVRQAVLVGFFGSEHSVLVPSAGNTTPATVSQGDLLAKQPGSIKVSLDGGAHQTVTIF
jgi:hypothetical protein